jgi:hypothetical protein
MKCLIMQFPFPPSSTPMQKKNMSVNYRNLACRSFVWSHWNWTLNERKLEITQYMGIPSRSDLYHHLIKFMVTIDWTVCCSWVCNTSVCIQDALTSCLGCSFHGFPQSGRFWNGTSKAIAISFHVLSSSFFHNLIYHLTLHSPSFWSVVK